MNPRYRIYHPRWHRDRLPIFWWLRRPAYARFITRELTSVAVGYAVLLLLLQAWAARHDAAWARVSGWLASAPLVLIHAVVFLVLVLHSVTWLNLAPKALVVRVGRRRLSDGAVIAGHYAAWAVASVLLIWFLVGRR